MFEDKRSYQELGQLLYNVSPDGASKIIMKAYDFPYDRANLGTRYLIMLYSQLWQD